MSKSGCLVSDSQFEIVVLLTCKSLANLVCVIFLDSRNSYNLNIVFLHFLINSYLLYYTRDLKKIKHNFTKREYHILTYFRNEYIILTNKEVDYE